MVVCEFCFGPAEAAVKVKHQSRVDDVQESEKVRIYHHEIHQKHVKRSAILKLQTDNELLIGHKACSEYLHHEVALSVFDLLALCLLGHKVRRVFGVLTA